MKRNNNSLPKTDFLSERNWIREFLDFNISSFEKELRNRPSKFWNEIGNIKALDTFHKAAERVPAYRNFLKKNKVDHKKIRKIEDFKNIPITDKKNYISSYALKDRCWDGKLSDSRLMAMSSGTSGEPTYWPRSDFQEYEANIIHELLYKYSFEIDDLKTLVVVCFPMGIYVSGMATALPTWINLSSKHKATFITPGNNKNEALRAIKNLWKDFEQIVMIGHPFFVKDVVETGRIDGLKWSSKEIKLMFCSEGFNEEWRSHVMKEAGIRNRNNTVSTYGSSEMLLMASESPLSVFIRNEADKNNEINQKLFDTKIVPSVFQYNPIFRYIESVDNELIFTVSGGVPLLRFNMHDSGQVLDFEKIKEGLGSLYKKIDSKNNRIWKLPFITLYGRSDHTVKFYAANIYPEHIRLALDHSPFLEKITGKFAIVKRINENLEQDLEINIELKQGHISDDNFIREVGERIYNKLKEINKEFLCICDQYKNKDLRPKVNLLGNGHEKYFKPGLKPRFIVNE